MSYDYEKYDGKRIVVDGEIIGVLAMEFGHEVEEVWEEYHAELAMTEEQSEEYKESLRRALSAQYEKVATLEAENAKLWELCRRFSEYVSQDRCEGCVYKTRCNNGLIDECWQLGEIRDLASELGMEVE